MKKIYENPMLVQIDLDAKIDTVSDSNTGGATLPVVTDGNEFGGWNPLG